MRKYTISFCLIAILLLGACGKPSAGDDQDFLADLSKGLTRSYALLAEQPQVQTLEELQQQDPQEIRQQQIETFRAEVKPFREAYVFTDKELEPLAEEYLSIQRELIRQLEDPQGEVDSDLSLRRMEVLYLLIEGWDVTVDAQYEESLHSAWLTGGYFYEKDLICTALEPMFGQVVLTRTGNAYTLSAENCSGYDLSCVGFHFQFFDASGALITEGNSGFQVDEYGLADVSGIPYTEEWNAGETLEATFTPATEFSRVEMSVSFCGAFARAHLPSPASTEFYEITWKNNE